MLHYKNCGKPGAKPCENIAGDPQFNSILQNALKPINQDGGTNDRLLTFSQMVDKKNLQRKRAAEHDLLLRNACPYNECMNQCPRLQPT